MSNAHVCTQCGACCAAPDIAALDKPLGVPCSFLTAECLCSRYETRPTVCRDYQPDALCDYVQAPTLHERVKRYLEYFGLEAEAQRVATLGIVSFKDARRLPLAKT
ncbi:MAG: YkgJ family cysteine cluster protein [Polyangiaceae bacterium]|nr:YkgJ family cysteine cluster protein [Polyangiaceae bacterium]